MLQITNKLIGLGLDKRFCWGFCYFFFGFEIGQQAFRRGAVAGTRS
jgi:hypothetical protein